MSRSSFTLFWDCVSAPGLGWKQQWTYSWIACWVHQTRLTQLKWLVEDLQVVYLHRLPGFLECVTNCLKLSLWNVPFRCGRWLQWIESLDFGANVQIAPHPGGHRYSFLRSLLEGQLFLDCRFLRVLHLALYCMHLPVYASHSNVSGILGSSCTYASTESRGLAERGQEEEQENEQH